MKKTAIIAGAGKLPEIIAKRLHDAGDPPVVFSLGADQKEIAASASEVVEVTSLDLKATMTAMVMRGIGRVIMAGVVPKKLIFDMARQDVSAQAFVASLSVRDDHSLLGGIVALFEKSGLEVAGYKDIIGDLIVPIGAVAGREPTSEERGDIDYGAEIARAVVPLSFGQSVVVHGRSVVAVEAMEGTDATIARAGSIVRGGVVVKMMRKDQDVRFDIPTVGSRTLEVMAEAGATCLALHAGSSLIVDLEDFKKRADDLGIAVVGIEG